MTDYDPGQQIERTALAWRRTGILLMVGAIVLCATTAKDRSYVVATAAAVIAVFAASEALRDPITHGSAGIGPWRAMLRIVVLGSGLGVAGAIAAIAQALR